MSKILGLDAYMKKVAAIVRATPALAPLAYARAAQHVRSLAMTPTYRGCNLELQAIANRLDELGAMSTVPETDAVDAEVISPWSDDPSGQIPTEFDGVVADFAAAKVDESGEPTSDLAQAAFFDRFQKERARETMTPVQVTPESAANSGNLLSNTVLVRYGGSSGSGSFTQGGVAGPVVAQQETELIRWDGDGEREAMPCVVAISPLVGGANATYPNSVDPSSGNNYSYRPYFHMFWGSGSRGQANEVYGDIGRGVQFVVHASKVYVNVGMDAFTQTVAVGPSVTYTPGAMYLTGNLGYFGGDPVSPVTRTVYIDQLASTTTVVVPLFARTLLPLMTTNTSGSTILDFQDAGGNQLYRVILSSPNTYPIPLSDDVYQILVNNTSGGGGDNYRLVFQLSL